MSKRKETNRIFHNQSDQQVAEAVHAEDGYSGMAFRTANIDGRVGIEIAFCDAKLVEVGGKLIPVQRIPKQAIPDFIRVINETLRIAIAEAQDWT